MGQSQSGQTYIYCNDLTYSYQETNHIAKKLANVLLELGVKKGDRVSLVLPNIPEFIFSAHAVMKTGAIIVPVNPLYTVPKWFTIFPTAVQKRLLSMDQ
jgi:long-chain acyl-CoA synthetase